MSWIAIGNHAPTEIDSSEPVQPAEIYPYLGRGQFVLEYQYNPPEWGNLSGIERTHLRCPKCRCTISICAKRIVPPGGFFIFCLGGDCSFVTPESPDPQTAIGIWNMLSILSR